jgi:ORF6N domain
MEKSAKTIVVTDEFIRNKIYHIRGHKVMLDEELAGLYEVSTKRLNEQDGVNSRQSTVGCQQPKAEACGLNNQFSLPRLVSRRTLCFS